MTDDMRISYNCLRLAGISQQTKGAEALLCCAIVALRRDAEGKPWTVAWFAQVYAEFIGGNAPAVIKNMYNACRGSDLTPRGYLELVVDFGRLRREN